MTDAPTPTPPFTDSGNQLWYPHRMDGLNGTIWVRLASDAAGGYVCSGFAIDAPAGAITTTVLKNIRLGAIIDELTAGLDGEDPAWLAINHIDLSAHRGILVIEPTPKRPAPRPKRGGKGPSGDEVATFATAYLAALKGPDRRRPIAAVSKTLNIDPSTAHRWKKAALTAGLLPDPTG